MRLIWGQNVLSFPDRVDHTVVSKRPGYFVRFLLFTTKKRPILKVMSLFVSIKAAKSKF